ncbi:MAG: hypothetical protein HY397_03485 [Candidatus Doudnabacteria bacterium]|nr:hypothetical protein [Candidatus Doudnabacteria bacterium]
MRNWLKQNPLITVILAAFAIGVLGLVWLSKTNWPRSAQPITRNWAEVAKIQGIRTVPASERSREVLRAYLEHHLKTGRDNDAGFYVKNVVDEPNSDESLVNLALHLKPSVAVVIPPAKLPQGMLRLLVDLQRDDLITKLNRWSPDLAEYAFAKRREAIWDLPPEMTSGKMIQILIREDLQKFLKNTSHLRSYFANLPGWTPRLAKDAFRRNWQNYRVIPERFRSYEMSRVAVSNDPGMLCEVPWEQRFTNNGELCQLALRKSSDAKHCVPEYFRFNFKP